MGATCESWRPLGRLMIAGFGAMPSRLRRNSEWRSRGLQLVWGVPVAVLLAAPILGCSPARQASSSTPATSRSITVAIESGGLGSEAVVREPTAEETLKLDRRLRRLQKINRIHPGPPFPGFHGAERLVTVNRNGRFVTASGRTWTLAGVSCGRRFVDWWSAAVDLGAVFVVSVPAAHRSSGVDDDDGAYLWEVTAPASGEGDGRSPSGVWRSASIVENALANRLCWPRADSGDPYAERWRAFTVLP